MITLDGATQYAYWDGHAAPVQGQGNQNELGGVCGFPLWICFDFKPASLAQNRFALALQDRFSTGRFAAQLSGSTIQLNNSAAAIAPYAGVQQDVWQRVLIYSPSRLSTTIYLDGDATAEDTTDNQWSAKNTFILGGRWESADTPNLFFTGSLANVAFGSGIISLDQRTGCVVGVNPLSLPGAVRYWPLKADASDFFGAWNLTLIGAPTITAVGHPDVDVYPPVGGGGGYIPGGLEGGLVA